jgi:hypothetical protein
MKKSESIQLIVQWQDRLNRIEGIEREYDGEVLSAMGSKPIKIITGFRRTGKSFLVQRVARRLVESGAFPLSNILYLNFEDFRLSTINSPDKLDSVYRAFRAEIATEGKKLLIFDEVQNVNQWDRFIRTIYETNSDSEIILTGSNSELLSSEIASRLAGRVIEFSILPFDFSEYLRFYGISVTNTVDYYRHQEKIQHYFNRYLKFGGLPETLSINSDTACFSYLEGILSKVILDDIIQRFNVKHTTAVEKVLLYLFSAVGNIVSFTRISNYLKQLDIGIKQETLIKYIQYMLKTFAVYEVGKFDWKLGKVFSTTRKYYAVDTGLINLYPNTVSNLSNQLENIVFLNLRKQPNPIYFGSLASGKEIDFIQQTEDGSFGKYQVSQTLHPDNYHRELSPFMLKGTYLEKGSNILLTLDEDEEDIEFKKYSISKKNLLRWLLKL